MPNQSQSYLEGDDTYGIEDPSDLQGQEAAAYARSQQNPSATNRVISAGLYSTQNLFGGSPQVQQAKRVQQQMQSILSSVNDNADPDEDPLAKQLRTAKAISQGMIGVAPQIALRAQDQAVRLAQAQKQQAFLQQSQPLELAARQQALDLGNQRLQQEAENLKESQFKDTLDQNTPRQVFLAEDQGKDENQIPMGLRQVKAYDLTDPSTPAQIHADMAEGAQNGKQLQVVNADQLNNSKLASAIAQANARIKASENAAAAREQAAAEAAAKGGNVAGDRFTDRILTATDIGSTSLANVASLPMGSSKGFFGMATKPAATLTEMTKEQLYNSLQPQDVQLYRTMTQPLFRTLATIESGGGLQGASGALMSNLKDTLTMQPTDTYLTMLSKLAEARQIFETGSDVYLKSKAIDPGKAEAINAKLQAMREAVPWTPQAVISFARQTESNPNLTFKQYAQKYNVASAGSDGRAQALGNLQSPPLVKDKNGVPARAVFGGGRRLSDNGAHADPGSTLTPNVQWNQDMDAAHDKLQRALYGAPPPPADYNADMDAAHQKLQRALYGQ
jgi:hypothetical protein